MLVSTDVLSVYVYVGVYTKDTAEESRTKQRIMCYDVSQIRVMKGDDKAS